MITRACVLVPLLAVALISGCGGSAEFVHTDYSRGVDLYDSGHYRAAVEAFDRAIVENTDSVHAWYNRGLACHDLYRATRGTGGPEGERWHARADVSYRRVLALDGGNPRAISSLAMLDYDSGDADGAVRQLEEQIAGGHVAGVEGETLPYWTLGAIYEHQGRVEQALHFYGAVLKMDGSHLAATTAMASLMMKLGADRWNEVDELLEAALETHKLDYTLRFQHAQVALARAKAMGDPSAAAEEWQEARQRLRVAASLNARDHRLHEGLADVAEASGDVGTAVRHLWLAREYASDRDLGSKAAAWRRGVSERLEGLYQRLGNWERDKRDRDPQEHPLQD